MEESDAIALAALGRFIRDFQSAATQLNTSRIGGQWWKMRVTAADAAAWANLGYLPEDAAPLIRDGITPAMVEDVERGSR